MNNRYKIVTYWQVRATVEVEAPSLEDAMFAVNEPDFALPTDCDPSYVEGSFEVDIDSTLEINE